MHQMGDSTVDLTLEKIKKGYYNHPSYKFIKISKKTARCCREKYHNKRGSQWCLENIIKGIKLKRMVKPRSSV